jgi:ATP-dependent protease ClpP protease subunit
MSKTLAAFFAVLVLFTGSASAQPAPVKARTVVLNSVIARGNVFPLADAMDKLAAKSKEPIDFIVNSPGGDVITGFLFINRMEALRAKGVTIRCWIPEVAASMAFQILLHCDERYSLSKAFLLWHRVRVSLGGGMFSSGYQMTAPLARAMATDLQSFDDIITEELNKTLDMPAADISFHFENETLHVGSNLERLAPNFIETYDTIPGLFKLLDANDVPRVDAGPGDVLGFQPGEIVYVFEGTPK